MNFIMEDVGPKITRLDIKAMENKISVFLPEDYKIFLLESNGGAPNPRYFLIEGWENNDKGGIDTFYGFSYIVQGFKYDLEEHFETYKGRIPTNLFPIACTGMGDVIVLSVAGYDKGKVYIWDHEQEHFPPTYDNIYKIADSFREFIDSIHYYDPLEGVDIESLLIK
jgi:hypothetical protein